MSHQEFFNDAMTDCLSKFIKSGVCTFYNTNSAGYYLTEFIINTVVASRVSSWCDSLKLNLRKSNNRLSLGPIQVLSFLYFLLYLTFHKSQLFLRSQVIRLYRQSWLCIYMCMWVLGCVQVCVCFCLGDANHLNILSGRIGLRIREVFIKCVQFNGSSHSKNQGGIEICAAIHTKIIQVSGRLGISAVCVYVWVLQIYLVGYREQYSTSIIQSMVHRKFQ